MCNLYIYSPFRYLVINAQIIKMNKKKNRVIGNADNRELGENGQKKTLKI